MAATPVTYDQLIEKLRGGLGEDIEKQLDKHLVSLRDTIKGLEAKALGLENAHTRFAEHVLATGTHPDAPKTEKGLTIARVCRALAASRGDRGRAIDWLKRGYSKDDRAVKALEQSESAREKIQQLAMELKAPQLASDLETGGVFIQPEFASDLIDTLRPMSVVQSLNPIFAPLNGTLAWSKKTTSTTATYVGEASNLPKTGIGTGQLVLTPKKLGAIVPISNDLLRTASMSADTIVRDDLALSISLRADLAKIRGLGTMHSPRGLRYWAAAANIIDTTVGGAGGDYGGDTTPTLAQLNNTFEEMVYRLQNANVPFIRPGWLWHPRTLKVLRGARDLDGRYVYRDEIMRGQFYGWPYRTTTQIPANLGGGADESENYLADFGDVIDAEQEGLIIDASREAAYYDGATLKSAFQEDSTVIRALMLHDFGARHDESIAVATGVKWSIPPVG